MPTKSPQSDFYYGFHRSLGDIRDQPADTSELKILAQVDPRDVMQDPYDQLALGACTANTYGGAVEYDTILDGDPMGTPARLAIYWGERKREGTLSYDSGAYGHDAFKDGKAFGVGPESLWPYDVSKFTEEPSKAYMESRAAHKFKDYRTPAQSEASIKRVLSNRQTVAIGITVYESFESSKSIKTGIIPMPTGREQVLGGHEILIVGYLEKYPDYFLCRNSWGTEVMMGGYFLLPVEYVLNRQLTSDLRTIYRPAGS